MAGYGFVTRWHLDAPIEEVWEAIYHCEHWPEWWNGVESVVELEPGDAQRVGSLWRCRWKSVLPYALNFDLRVTRVVPPVALDGVAAGELAGEGLWRLFRSSAGTLVRYEWTVVTTARWMNALAPLARRVFAWNHDIVMRQGGEGLARLMAGSHGS